MASLLMHFSERLSGMIVCSQGKKALAFFFSEVDHKILDSGL